MPLLLVFILMFRVSPVGLSGTSFKWVPVSFFDMSPTFFFWVRPYFVVPVHFYCPCLRLQMSCFFLAPDVVGVIVETKIWVLGVLIAAGVSLLLGYFRIRAGKLHIFVKQEFVLTPQGSFLTYPVLICIFLLSEWDLHLSKTSVYLHVCSALLFTQNNLSTATPTPLPIKIY